MRQSTLACLAAVSLSLGPGAMFPTGAAAQPNDPEAAMRALSRRVRIDITKQAGATPTVPILPKFTLAPNPSGFRQDGTGDPAFGPAMDCNMPVIKGDPSIDPRIVQRIREDGTTYTLRVIAVPRCAHPR